MFGKLIAVKFVAEGVTAEDARREAKKQIGPTKAEAIKALCAFLGLLGVIFMAIRDFAPGLLPDFLSGATATAQTVAVKATKPPKSNPPTITATTTPIFIITVPTVTLTPTSTLTPPPIPLATTVITRSILHPYAFWSPISTPTATPPASSTPTPAHNYELINYQTTPAELYPFISGWLFEHNGQTPRPAAITLHYPTGAMHYPRPGNTDIATGRYEFLVSPGTYQIILDDLIVPITVMTIPQRYELNFRYTKANTLTTPARSNPWGNYKPNDPNDPNKTHQPNNNQHPTATYTPTPPPIPMPNPSIVYISFLLKNHTPPLIHHPPSTIQSTIYLPMLLKHSQPIPTHQPPTTPPHYLPLIWRTP